LYIQLDTFFGFVQTLLFTVQTFFCTVQTTLFTVWISFFNSLDLLFLQSSPPFLQSRPTYLQSGPSFLMSVPLFVKSIPLSIYCIPIYSLASTFEICMRLPYVLMGSILFLKRTSILQSVLWFLCKVVLVTYHLYKTLHIQRSFFKWHPLTNKPDPCKNMRASYTQLVVWL